jgi:cytochrome c5
MKIKFALAAILLISAMSLGLAASATSGGKDAPKDASVTSSAPADQAAQNESMHFEGEKRFRANCGRCHAAPPKFRPRMMATIVRHMRVRAAITDQDMHLILRYMTE